MPESSCTRKETVDIDILVTSRIGDRKIMQSVKQQVELPQEKGSGTITRSSKRRTNSPAYLFL